MRKRKSVTLRDIAEHTGLSRATVDRVINERGNVRPETREAVEAAISALRYSGNRLSSMIDGDARHVEVFLSEGANPFFREIWANMEAACAATPGPRFVLNGFNPYRPETLVAGLSRVGPKTDAVILVGVDNPDVAAELVALSARGVRVVTIVSDVSSSASTVYVGQDNFMSGKAAARLMSTCVPDRAGTVAILIGHLQFRHLLDRRSGFEQLLAMSRPDLTPLHVKPYGDDASGIGRVLAEVLERHPDLSGLYLCGSGQPEIYDAVRALKPGIAFIAHEVTERSRAALADGSLTAIVASDMAEITRLAVGAALAAKGEPAPVASIRIHVRENLPPVPQ